MIQKAASTHLSVAQIIAEGSNVSPAVKSKLPCEQSLRGTIKRVRRVQNVPVNPSSYKTLHIPDEEMLTLDKKKFLCIDTGAADKNRIIIFATNDNIEFLKSADTWFIDGTFKTCPPLFKQLYTVHGNLLGDNLIPLVYMLLPGKSEEIYRRAFTLLREILGEGIKVKTVRCDFEKAAHNAIESVFNKVQLSGCLFHFQQCIWRAVQASGNVAEKYRTQENYAIKLRYLAGLAFVPKEDVVAAYQEVLSLDFFKQHEEELLDILTYFENTWIGRRHMLGNARHPPKFPLSVWSCYELVRMGQDKTTNKLEAWHRSFTALVSCSHPSIWSFIEKLRLEQSRNEFKIRQLLSGGPGVRSKKIYKDVATRIAKIVSQYGQRSLEDYLDGIAMNFAYQAHY
jgi:hypothetical protein